jgi:hypothetical protein
MVCMNPEQTPQPNQELDDCNDILVMKLMNNDEGVLKFLELNDSSSWPSYLFFVHVMASHRNI